MTSVDTKIIEINADQPLNSSASSAPGYLHDIYQWAYLNKFALALFNNRPIVSAILWGNYGRLFRAVLDEVNPGDHAMQLAAVYGPFSPDLVDVLGESGRLDIVEVAQIQVEMTRQKLIRHKNARVLQCDAANPPIGEYDLVVSFFLLHEVPEDYKTRIVDSALNRLNTNSRCRRLIERGWHRTGDLIQRWRTEGGSP